ncbi:MAG: hypothetical protein AAF388_03455 [Bacteroidota bacterium]
MNLSGIHYRINYTKECFYSIDFDNQIIEVVYDLGEAYRAIKRIRFETKLARELTHTLYEIEAEVYSAAKNYIHRMQQVKLDSLKDG